MPTITPALVPTKNPGTLFSSLTGGDTTLNIRWLTALDPCFYEILNRPVADIAVRQLVIAKAVDALQIQAGRQALFPYVTQPRVSSGTDEVDIPIGWIWDFHASMPKKWENLRLAKIKRISGANDTTDGYTGKLRLIFMANVENSTTEVALFQADYTIDSTLTYQPVRLTVVDNIEETSVVNSGESETLAGFMIFHTMDLTADAVQLLLDLLAPPTDVTAGSDGLFTIPATYEVSDSAAGGTAVTDDYSVLAMSHGTGLLTDSAWNAIPQLDSDIQLWITGFNYPFDVNANRTSTIGIVIPNGLFREFNITAPAGDQPTGDTSGTFFPVWISRIERIGTGTSQLRFYFSTYNVTDTESDGSPSTTAIEFASLDLSQSFTDGEIVEIVPIEDLQLQIGTGEEYQQHFGRGHVTLSSLWDGTSGDVGEFFDAFDTIADSPVDTEFSVGATRISSFGVSRVPKYVPTIGQSRALTGSTSRRSTPIPPSYDNRFITEKDQGTGNQIDLEARAGINPHAAIDRYGYSGGLAHQMIKLVIDGDLTGSDPNFYDEQVLPRMRILFGRDPQFGDFWYNGVRYFIHNGDSWVG